MGDLDLVINNLEDLASIYRNNATQNNYLSLEIVGNKSVLPNGSKVSVYSDQGLQLQEYNVVRGYLSLNFSYSALWLGGKWIKLIA